MNDSDDFITSLTASFKNDLNSEEPVDVLNREISEEADVDELKDLIKKQIYSLENVDTNIIKKIYTSLDITNDTKIELLQDLLLHLTLEYKVGIDGYESVSQDIEQLVSIVDELYTKLIINYKQTFKDLIMFLIITNKDAISTYVSKNVDVNTLVNQKFIAINLKKAGKEYSAKKVTYMIAALEIIFKNEVAFRNNKAIIKFEDSRIFNNNSITASSEEFFSAFFNNVYSSNDVNLIILQDELKRTFLYRLIGVE